MSTSLYSHHPLIQKHHEEMAAAAAAAAVGSGLVVDSSLFQLVLSDAAVGHLKDFLVFLVATGVRLYAGSLIVQITPEQRAIIQADSFASELISTGGIQLKPTVPGVTAADLSELSEDVLTWDDDLLLDLARRNASDEASAKDFYSYCNATFEVGKTGSLKVLPGNIKFGQHIYIRFRSLIQQHSGMKLQLPTLCLKYSDDAKVRMKQINRNKCMMFGLFVAAYGTYFQLCKNLGMKNKFDQKLNLSDIDIGTEVRPDGKDEESSRKRANSASDEGSAPKKSKVAAEAAAGEAN